MRIFAERLREIQNQRHCTQKEMAELIGITQASLSAYMKDIRIPALDIAVKIANVFGVSVGWLCGEELQHIPSNLKRSEIAGILYALTNIDDGNLVSICADGDKCVLEINDKGIIQLMKTMDKTRKAYTEGYIDQAMYNDIIDGLIERFER